MKCKGLIVFILVATFGLAFLAPDAQAQQAGAIVGTVLDEQGNPLVGAEVTIAELNLVTSTDAQGRFRLTGIPPGPQKVIVLYLSAAAADARDVVIESGSTTDLQFALKRFSEEIEVRAPILEGEASALNQQKTAPNITNVVSPRTRWDGSRIPTPPKQRNASRR